MRILIVHNRYQQKGGEDTVVAAEEWLLRSHGHQVELLQVDNDHIQDAFSRVTAAVQSIYSLDGKKKMRKVLGSYRPDLVHVHNFFPSLSPSIFIACAEAQVPVVHTLHNYRIVCAASTLFREGKVCEECLSARSFLPGVKHGCYRSNWLGSAISGLGMALHAEIGTWTSSISAYIALTQFAADKLGSFRIPPGKIFVKPNFVVDRGIGNGDGNYALFVGRLSPEKGLQTLIDADQAGSLCMDVVLLGEGPMRPAIEQAASRSGSRLRLKGFVGHEEIVTYMKGARVLFLTSLWYEGDPLVVIEAFSMGLPVIAAAIGNTAATVRAKETGLLYPPGDHAGLSSALEWYAAHPEAVERMRQNARDYYLATHTPEVNYERLLQIYGYASGEPMMQPVARKEGLEPLNGMGQG
jgi:glycosyltransferase involved in cell wall biosynthesis